MANMLGKSGKWFCSCGPYVAGLRIRNKRARRIARAREKALFRRIGRHE